MIWALIWHVFRHEPEDALPVESRMMQWHLAGAALFLVAVGSCLPGHAAKAWKAKSNRTAGAALLVLMSVVMLSAFGLLAFEWEAPARNVIHLAHLGGGSAMGVMFAVHVALGRRRKKKDPTA